MYNCKLYRTWYRYTGSWWTSGHWRTWVLAALLCHISSPRLEWIVWSDLIFSRPRSEGWPHYGRTFSIYPCPLSFWLTLPRVNSKSFIKICANWESKKPLNSLWLCTPVWATAWTGFSPRSLYQPPYLPPTLSGSVIVHRALLSWWLMEL